MCVEVCFAKLALKCLYLFLYQHKNKPSCKFSGVPQMTLFYSQCLHIALSTVDFMHVFTPNNNTYMSLHMTVLSQTTLMFRVKAPMEAYVALSNIPRNLRVQTYELIIGAEVDIEFIMYTFICVDH